LGDKSGARGRRRLLGKKGKSGALDRSIVLADAGQKIVGCCG
jgi:hypothetical protein